MMQSLVLDPGRSRFTAHAYATGLLSVVAHSPTFAVRAFHGRVTIDAGEPRRTSVELEIQSGSLELLDQVSDSDREDIEGRMRREVLAVEQFPEISYRSDEVSTRPVGPDHFHVHINGILLLHGVTHPHPIDAEMALIEGGFRVRGGCSLLMSTYQIKPVTALGGLIKLKDEMKLAFDIICMEEGA